MVVRRSVASSRGCFVIIRPLELESACAAAAVGGWQRDLCRFWPCSRKMPNFGARNRLDLPRSIFRY